MAALAALALATPPASGQTDECRTRTTRPRADIIASGGPLTSGGVRIRAGEVLCITGRPNADGLLEDLALVEGQGDAAPAVIELRLLRNGKTLLIVRHASPFDLEYAASGIVARSSPSLLPQHRRGSTHAVGAEEWDPRVQEVFLTDFRFRLPPEASPPRPESRGFWIGLDVLAVERHAPMDSLNAAIAADGFAPIGNNRALLGLGVSLAFERLRFGVEAYALDVTPSDSKHTVSRALDTSLGEAGLFVGYDVFRYQHLSLFLATGVYLGGLGLNPTTPGLTLFDGQLEPREFGDAEWSYSALPLELGVDYVVPLTDGYKQGAFRFGTRLSWVQQLGGTWQLDERDLRSLSGPELDLSGPRALIVLGVAFMGHQQW